MRIVIPGGTGQVGTILNRAFGDAGHEVVIVTRRPTAKGQVAWDGQTMGEWAGVIDGSDVVINLAGRSVNCRYTKTNLTEMMRSRVLSDLRASLRRLQRRGHRRIALRSAIVLSPDRGGAFDVLSRLARVGLGGPVAGGSQYVSWIHDHDFAAAVRFLIDRDDLSGPVNLAAPGPEPQRDFMRGLRDSWGVHVGLPATKWMAELGAFAIRSDTELLLKSRRMMPGRLLTAGFEFSYGDWASAARDLVRRARAARQGPAGRKE